MPVLAKNLRPHSPNRFSAKLELPEGTVEWLEQGRSCCLEIGPCRCYSRKTLSTLSEQTQSSTMSLQRALAIDKLLQDIRKLPGFGRSLLQKEFSRLRASTNSGPVVILNATGSRRDALIVLTDVNHAIHAPPPCERARPRHKE